MSTLGISMSLTKYEVDTHSLSKIEQCVLIFILSPSNQILGSQAPVSPTIKPRRNFFNRCCVNFHFGGDVRAVKSRYMR
jgi:hypothetical protein